MTNPFLFSMKQPYNIILNVLDLTDFLLFATSLSFVSAMVSKLFFTWPTGYLKNRVVMLPVKQLLFTNITLADLSSNICRQVFPNKMKMYVIVKGHVFDNNNTVKSD